jgi:hypothetical protein
MTLNEWIVKADQNKLELIRRYDKGEAPIESIIHLPLVDIKKNIPDLMQEGKYDEVISKVLSEDVKVTLKRKELDRFRILVWIEKQYEEINNREKLALERPPDFKMIASGIKKLDDFGYINTVDMLAGGDVTKWSEIEQLPYEVCFTKQYKTTIENDIQKKLLEINSNDRKK